MFQFYENDLSRLGQPAPSDVHQVEKEVLKISGGTPRYGSDIVDEDEVQSNLSLDFDDKKTEASVQSFSRICKVS